MALAAAQVEAEQLGGLGQQHVQGGPVPLSEVHHMYVIADAAAIGGGPVAAKHLQAVATPHRHLAHKGEQVVGYAPGVFADAPTGVGSHRIEVAQPGDAPARLTGDQVG